jgi:hypothetical protein
VVESTQRVYGLRLIFVSARTNKRNHQSLQWEDGEEKPLLVCFLSRKLQGSQFRYDARNVEALAPQIDLSVWRPLLYGVRFELISDHASLVTLLTQKALSPRLLWLCEFLADFNFEEVR